MTGDSGRDDRLIEHKELLFLPRRPHLKLLKLLRTPRGISLLERADAYRRLAVIHKASIPEKRERVLARNKAKKEMESNDLLNEVKNPYELEDKIQETKQAIHLLSRQIRMFEKNESENKEKDRLLEEKTFKQKRLEKLEKFIGEENIGLEDSIQETKDAIQKIETKIMLFQKNGYKEKIRLEAEKESEEKKLEAFEIFLEKVTNIMAWQKYLEESKRSILQSWAFEKDPKKIDWIIEFYSRLKEIEAQ